MSERKKGATSVSLEFRLTDVTTGAPKTGLDVTTLKLQYHRPGEAPSTATALTLLAAQTTAWAAYGAKEVDATNSPGVYRVDCPDAAFAGTPDEVTLTVNSAAIQPSTRLIDLLTIDLRASTVPADVQTIKTQAVTAASGVTFPASVGTSTFSGGAVASVTNPVTVGTNNDKTGYLLTVTPPTASAIAAAVLTDTTDTGTAGSLGHLITTAPGWYTAPDNTDVAAIKTKTDNLPASFPTNFSALGITSGGKVSGVVLVDALTTYTGNTPQTGDLYAVVNPMVTSHVFTSAALANAPGGGSGGATASEIATAVWTDTADLTTVGSPGYLLAQNLDAKVSTRSTFAGGAVASVTAGVNLNLAQTGLTPRALGSVADASLTVGDALVCAIVEAAGQETVVGTAYAKKTPFTATTIRTLTLDSATAPTART